MIPKLYDQYFVKKEDERRHLFQILSERFNLESGIYPGSFVHLTPAFYIREMIFIDNDRRINRFFSDPTTLEYINEQKIYNGEPKVIWRQGDYTEVGDLNEYSCDIMFSFYAGFISRHCKRFLKDRGVLIANNSHGDATLALSDPDYTCLGVILRNNQRFQIKTEEIEPYITKKNGSAFNLEKVREKMIGEKFSRYAYAYMFRKCCE
ncbi:hypothetical protein [Salinispira pacifica]|uniref:Uncharacterized protein n=1 Tax=Salinispira pacifica TaxID=1307761 RepID=V5WJD8_9SPIO|nr:hypothetical protein [Salinispira pacifica]AHC15942.1 hypothetical protein L21SP2_2590 [Salinispira pacifica]